MNDKNSIISYEDILKQAKKNVKKTALTEKEMEQLTDDVYNITDIESFQNYQVKDLLDIQYNLYKQEYLMKFDQIRYDSMNKEQKLEFLKEKCLYSKQLQIQQYNLQNIFTLYSQMKSLLLFHDPGLGKTIATLSILNNFRQYYQQNQQKIYIVVPGVIFMKLWRDEILKYFKLFLSYDNLSDQQILSLINKEFSIMTKQTFHQIIQQQLLNIQHQIDNCFIVIDEAHHLSDIQIAKDLVSLLQTVKNTRILLLSGTPMKNRADNIIDILNILRVCNNPKNKVISKYEIFDYGHYVDDIRIKDPQKLMEYSYGYVSCLKNTDKIAFAQPIYHGVIPYGVKFSYLIQCKIGPFQKLLQENMLLHEELDEEEENNEISKQLLRLLQKINKKRQKLGLDIFSIQNVRKLHGNEELYEHIAEYIEDNIERYFHDKDSILDDTYNTTKDPDTMKDIATSKFRQDLDFRFLVSSNLAIPKINGDQITPVYSYKELLILIKNLKNQQMNTRMNDLLKALLKKNGYDVSTLKQNQLIQLTHKQDYIQGSMFNINFIGFFSIKLHTMMMNILKEIPLQYTILIYSNFKIFGTDLIEQTLISNGFIQYKQNMQYDIQDNTLDALTGITYIEFKEKYPNKQFYPCTYFKISGEETKDMEKNNKQKEKQMIEQEIENSKQILDNVFNSIRNIDGKIIKIFIGSKVIAEGISVSNCGSLHIFDQSFNFSRIKQVFGRPIRWCRHLEKQLQQNNPEQIVNIRRYVTCDEYFEDYLKKNQETQYKLSIEETIVRKSEMKYILIKQVERILNRNAIDCVLNYDNNNPIEKLEKCRSCIPIDLDKEYTFQEKKQQCPEECEFLKCGYKCNMNDKYNKELHYDEELGIYKKEKTKSTFYINFQNIAYELQQVRQIVQNIFVYEQEFTFEKLYDKILQQSPQQLRLLLQKKLLLIVMSKISINKFNLLLNDSIIIYNNKLKKSFILFDEKTGIFKLIPVKYFNKYGIYDANIDFYEGQYGQYSMEVNDISKFISTQIDEQKYFQYDKRYYQTKKFNKICGILCDDQRQGQQQTQTIYCIKQLKIKIFNENKDKQKETDLNFNHFGYLLQNLQKKQILQILRELGIQNDKKQKKQIYCNRILQRLVNLEKYSTDYFYIILPFNQPFYPFPLNFLDRLQSIEQQLIQSRIQYQKEEKKVHEDDLIKNIPYEQKFYIIKIKQQDKKLNEQQMQVLEKIGFDMKTLVYVLS